MQEILENQNYTFFHKKDSPFSQQNKKGFVLRGKLFDTVEQYVCWKKAILFNDLENAQNILDTDSSTEQKKFARQVKGADDYRWQKNREQYLYEAFRAKFLQNSNLLPEFYATRGTTLVYANQSDKTWGIGLGINNADIEDTSCWRGENILGNVLTQLREDIFSSLEINKLFFRCWDVYLRKFATENQFPENNSNFYQEFFNILNVEIIDHFEENELSEITKDTLSIEWNPAEEQQTSYIEIIHECYHGKYVYPVGLIASMNTQEKELTQIMYHYWVELEKLENYIHDREDSLKAYLLFLTNEDRFVNSPVASSHEGIDQEESKSPPEDPFATTKSKGRITGTLHARGADTPITLRGIYNMNNWVEKENYAYILQQINKAQWALKL